MLGQPNCAIKWSRKHVRFILYAVYYFDKMFVSIEIDIILLRLIHSCAAAAFLPIMYVCFFSFPLLCSEFSSSALFTHFFIYFLKIPSIVYFHLSFWQDLIRSSNTHMHTFGFLGIYSCGKQMYVHYDFYSVATDWKFWKQNLIVIRYLSLCPHRFHEIAHYRAGMNEWIHLDIYFNDLRTNMLKCGFKFIARF